MKIGIPAETRPGGTRVAATPETVKKLSAKHQVIVQAGAGLPASFIDEAFVAAGATIGSVEIRRFRGVDSDRGVGQLACPAEISSAPQPLEATHSH